MGIFGYALCVMGAAICISVVATSAANNMARQPEVQGLLFTVFILGCAFIEALTLIGFVVTLMVK